MTKLIRSTALAVAALSLTSCASWLMRQECKKINWYQHGYDAAMAGRRLTGDEMIGKCRDADFDLPEQELDVGFKAGMANYCKPDIVFTTGKNGDFFNTDLCDPGQARVLSAKHAEGVKAYCAKDNGFNAGSSGKKYKNICPPELEKAWLPEYKRGRKSYLGARVSNAEKQLAAIDARISGYERERMNLSYQRNMLPPAREIRERVYNPTSGSYTDQARLEDPSENRRRQLDGEIGSLNSRIDSANSEKEAVRKQIADDRMELATLP